MLVKKNKIITASKKMTNKKITQRERSARLRPNISNASADVIWNAVHDWFHHERADKQLCADRAGVSRGCVIGILSHEEAPSERSPRVPPAVDVAGTRAGPG